MSTFRHPVGEQPPSVYWRRRLLVGVGIVVVIVVILLIVFAPKGGKTAAAPSHTPATSSTPKATSAPAVTACSKDDITVTGKVDQSSYSTESQPQLSFTITNDGTVACKVKAGSDVQLFEITSGPEVYWKSTDCQTDPQPYTAIVQPGKSISSGKIGWDRTRSSKKTCNSDRSAVPANGASYHLVVTVDGVKSSNSPQFVLD